MNPTKVIHMKKIEHSDVSVNNKSNYPPIKPMSQYNDLARYNHPIPICIAIAALVDRAYQNNLNKMKKGILHDYF